MDNFVKTLPFRSVEGDPLYVSVGIYNMVINKMNTKIKLEKSRPSGKMSTFFIELNRYTIFYISNQSSEMNFRAAIEEKVGYFGRKKEEEDKLGFLEKIRTYTLDIMIE